MGLSYIITFAMCGRRALRPGHKGPDNENDRDGLNCSTQNTPTLIQPIEGVHFYRYRFRSRYRGLCDWAFTHWNICERLFLYIECATLKYSEIQGTFWTLIGELLYTMDS